ncbi:hypothetical protein [Marinobacter shengliensis]|uniref:hypothetical protein n=1 Tax=Marinobacter shengliensis TaxID=1389223 RepID=UPI000D0EC932|nr:hypothetical protein [Marinobacter shengliensis]PSF14417.1 hypothetical protein C7H10_03780 [Marinobacter shengliensis]
MTEEEKGLASIQQILAIGTAAALIISCINLYFYWNVFDINIFNHITIPEILARSAFPLILTSSTFLGVILALTNTKITDNTDQRGSYFKEFKSILLVALSFFTTGIIALYLGDFRLLPMMAMGTLMLLFTTKKFNRSVNYITQISGIPSSLNIALVIMATISSTHSMGSALNIKAGKSYKYAEIETMSENITGAYIGRSDSSVFIWKIERKETLIVSQSEIKKIKLIDSSNMPEEKAGTEENSTKSL